MKTHINSSLERMMRNNGKAEPAKFRIFLGSRLVFWTDDEPTALKKAQQAIDAGLEIRMVKEVAA